MLSIHELGVPAAAVNACGNKLAAEIEEANEFPVSDFPAKREDMAVPGILRPDIGFGREAGFSGANLF